MDTALTLLWQVVIMFLLAGVGYAMFKTGKITIEGSKSLANILIFLSLPCVIINGFLVERTTEHLVGLGLSFVAAAVILAISIVVSRLFFKKDPIASFGASFSNPGFFGIPLIVAIFSQGTVFYIAAFIAMLNLLQWSYGVSLLTGKAGSVNPMRVIKAPFIIAILIGLFFFLTGLPMPMVLGKCISNIAGLNTSLAMFTVGVYLAQTDLVKMFTKPVLYLVSAVRLVIIPLICLALLCLVPNSLLELKMALLIASACPVGSNVATYAQLHNSDYPYAVETVVISTIFAIVTMPLLVSIASMLWM